MTYLRLCLVVVLTLVVAGCGGPSDPEPADLVLLHGKIVTVDDDMPEAQALAAKDGVILALGSDADIEPYIGDDTRVLDIEGLLAVPGLIEGHGHYMSYGASLMELDLRHARDWDHIVSMVEDAVAEAEPNEWIVGRGWHQDKWESRPEPSVEGLPTHETLSAASPEKPCRGAVILETPPVGKRPFCSSWGWA